MCEHQARDTDYGPFPARIVPRPRPRRHTDTDAARKHASAPRRGHSEGALNVRASSGE